MHGLPRGILLNNPGNIRKSTIDWKGEVLSHDKDFEQFDTLEHGIRALLKLLLNYYKLRDCTTVAKIIERYAPPDNGPVPTNDHNPTENYTDFVAKHCGVDRNNQYNVCDAGNLFKIASAIIEFEQGSDQYIPQDQIKTEIDKLLPPVS